MLFLLWRWNVSELIILEYWVIRLVSDCVQYNYYKLPFAKEKVLTSYRYLLYFILYILFLLSHDSLMLPNRTFTYRLLILRETNNQVNISIWLSDHLPSLPYNGNKTYSLTKTAFKKKCLSNGLSDKLYGAFSLVKTYRNLSSNKTMWSLTKFK